MPDKTQTENTDVEPVQGDEEKKGRLIDRVSDALRNPTPELEARFQEHIKNN